MREHCSETAYSSRRKKVRQCERRWGGSKHCRRTPSAGGTRGSAWGRALNGSTMSLWQGQ